MDSSFVQCECGLESIHSEDTCKNKGYDRELRKKATCSKTKTVFVVGFKPWDRGDSFIPIKAFTNISKASEFAEAETSKENEVHEVEEIDLVE